MKKNPKQMLQIEKDKLVHYVYGLKDPDENYFFYFGQGQGNRLFAHEKEAQKTDVELDNLSDKIKKIREIIDKGKEVEEVIICWGLTKKQADAAEAALINAARYLDSREDKLTNIVSGIHNHEALSVQDFLKWHGAKELEEKDIKNQKILVIKINKLYPSICKERKDKKLHEEQLYNAVRGNWRLSKERAEKCTYVFAVYNSLIVGVYIPSKWMACKDNLESLPNKVNPDENLDNRYFFIDEDYNKRPKDEIEKYLGKKISKFSNNKSQNPISYLEKGSYEEEILEA